MDNLEGVADGELGEVTCGDVDVDDILDGEGEVGLFKTKELEGELSTYNDGEAYLEILHHFSSLHGVELLHLSESLKYIGE